jgi:hypothetical protein
MTGLIPVSGKHTRNPMKRKVPDQDRTKNMPQPIGTIPMGYRNYSPKTPTIPAGFDIVVETSPPRRSPVSGSRPADCPGVDGSHGIVREKTTCNKTIAYLRFRQENPWEQSRDARMQ